VSTTYLGTTDTELQEVLEGGSGMKAGTDFHLAFSPEREDPANATVKVAAGKSLESVDAGSHSNKSIRRPGTPGRKDQTSEDRQD
jgi:UDP-N-acetyl-D-mannosaminuronate dehydrogenase